jgi:hypothetical protein
LDDRLVEVHDGLEKLASRIGKVALEGQNIEACGQSNLLTLLATFDFRLVEFHSGTTNSNFLAIGFHRTNSGADIEEDLVSHLLALKSGQLHIPAALGQAPSSAAVLEGITKGQSGIPAAAFAVVEIVEGVACGPICTGKPHPNLSIEPWESGILRNPNPNIGLFYKKCGDLKLRAALKSCGHRGLFIEGNGGNCGSVGGAQRNIFCVSDFGELSSKTITGLFYELDGDKNILKATGNISLGLKNIQFWKNTSIILRCIDTKEFLSLGQTYSENINISHSKNQIIVKLEAKRNLLKKLSPKFFHGGPLPELGDGNLAASHEGASVPEKGLTECQVGSGLFERAGDKAAGITFCASVVNAEGEGATGRKKLIKTGFQVGLGGSAKSDGFAYA